jgi:general L-amino acid transport system substrate-binding protein
MPQYKLAACALALAAVSSHAIAGPTLDAVKKRGYVQCGVSTGIQGFSAPDGKGAWHGLDVDMCRAIAAAVFNDAAKYRLTPLTTQARFTALQSGEVDVLTRNTTVTLTRDTTLGLIGVGVNYYDSQGVMVSKDLNVKSAKELNGATICVQPGTTTELNLADWFRGQKIEFKPVVIDKYDEIIRAFSAGRCDAFTTDKSQLASTRTSSSSCRKTSPRSPWAPWSARATSNGSTSSAGRSTPCWKPRNTASPRPTSMK